MFTAKSLVNKKRRFLELRKINNKLRSLKRKRFSNRVLKKRIGDDIALIKMLEHIEQFLSCSFEKIQPPIHENRLASKNLISSIQDLRNDCIIAASEMRPVKSKIIRNLGKASTHLYQISRKSEPNWDCDEAWMKSGFCAHRIF